MNLDLIVSEWSTAVVVSHLRRACSGRLPSDTESAVVMRVSELVFMGRIALLNKRSIG